MWQFTSLSFHYEENNLYQCHACILRKDILYLWKSEIHHSFMLDHLCPENSLIILFFLLLSCRQEEVMAQRLEAVKLQAEEAMSAAQVAELQAEVDKWRQKHDQLWQKVKPFEVQLFPFV